MEQTDITVLHEFDEILMIKLFLPHWESWSVNISYFLLVKNIKLNLPYTSGNYRRYVVISKK